MNYINGAVNSVEAPPESLAESLPAIHPVANKLPSPDARSYKQTKEDIKKHGLKVAITRYQGRIIDGRTRQQICMELGIEPKYIDLEGDLSDEQLEALSRSLNVHRRHLSRGQKAMLISAELAADPELSDRAVAKKVGVSHRTVAAKRREQEAVGQLPTSPKRTGKDGKKYKAPPAKAVSSKANSKPHITADEIAALGTPDSRAAAEDRAREIAKLSPNTLEPEEAATPKTPAPFDPYKDLALRLTDAMDGINKALQEAREKENFSLSNTEEKLFTGVIIKLGTLVHHLQRSRPQKSTARSSGGKLPGR